MTDVDPPPGAVFDLAERAVEFVRRAVKLTLDYTLETLPVLDHYLAQVPRDQPDTVRLIAACAGAYFGEVARRQLGGVWEDTTPEDPGTWMLELTGGVRISPVGMAGQAVLGGDSDDFEGSFVVPTSAQAVVEDALSARGAVAENEYYSLSGRLEVLMLIVDVTLATSQKAKN